MSAAGKQARVEVPDTPDMSGTSGASDEAAVDR